MLNAFMLATVLSLTPAPSPSAGQTAIAGGHGFEAGQVILVRGGPGRNDPFAELREKRRQEAERKKQKTATEKN